VHADDAFFTVEAFLPSLTTSRVSVKDTVRLLLLLASFVRTHRPHRARTLIPPELFDSGESETDSHTCPTYPGLPPIRVATPSEAHHR
jgi:hypothetical protein